MTPQQYLEFMRNRYHTYAYLKYCLKDCKDQLEFHDKSKDLLEEIFEDEKMYFDFSKNSPLLAPIQKEYENLSHYSQTVLQFFVAYKQLNDY